MSSFMEVLSHELQPGVIGALSRNLGADEKATQRAVQGALPLLVAALASNASRSGGARALWGALERDHDGKILNDVSGFLHAGETTGGDKILGHVLGRRRPAFEQGLARMSGLDAPAVAKLLPMLAPILMAALGRAQRDNRLDAFGLAELLGNEREHVQRKAPDAMGALGALLDADGDGSTDDVARAGASVLGKLFR